MKTGFLDNMAPNAQRAFIVTVVFALLAGAIYMFAVIPAISALDKAKNGYSAAEMERTRIDMTLKNYKLEKGSLSEVNARLKEYSRAMIERRLGNYATHAREILDSFAIGAGLTDIDYPETSVRKLPLPDPNNAKYPTLLHERVAVRMTARSSYQAAVSFILRTEAELPLVSVQSLKIAADRGNPLKQQIDITLEWPAVGPDEPPPAQNARR